MEVMDKLLSSLGQDLFDSLYWQTRHNPHSPKLVSSFSLVCGYVMLHSGLYFLQVATLTVVINSADEALITVLILNNFSEIRAFVFKKYDCNHLFQLSCADITERFQILLSIVLILTVALAQAGPVWKETMPPFLRIAVYMFSGEVVITSHNNFLSLFDVITTIGY